MKKVLLLCAILIGLNSQVFGFASIVTAIKGGDKIFFNLNKRGVEVYLDGNKVGTASELTYEYKLKRDGVGHLFTFKKEGYVDANAFINTTIDPLIWGNILLGGLVGSTIDSLITNADRQYTPNQFYIDMIKKGNP